MFNDAEIRRVDRRDLCGLFSYFSVNTVIAVPRQATALHFWKIFYISCCNQFSGLKYRWTFKGLNILAPF